MSIYYIFLMQIKVGIQKPQLLEDVITQVVKHFIPLVSFLSTDHLSLSSSWRIHSMCSNNIC